MILQEKRARIQMLEKHVEDRDIKVYNAGNKGKNFSTLDLYWQLLTIWLVYFMSRLDEFVKQMRFEDEQEMRYMEKQEDEIQNTAILKFLKVRDAIMLLTQDNEEARNFSGKMMKELKALQKKKVYPRTTVRIKFPDEHVLQAKFGALEKVSTVFDLVHSVSKILSGITYLSKLSWYSLALIWQKAGVLSVYDATKEESDGHGGDAAEGWNGAKCVVVLWLGGLGPDEIRRRAVSLHADGSGQNGICLNSQHSSGKS